MNFQYNNYGHEKTTASSIVSDQTPTPTKFLKYGEEIGLFMEINSSKNPFDDAFKSATENNFKTGKAGTPSSEVSS